MTRLMAKCLDMLSIIDGLRSELHNELEPVALCYISNISGGEHHPTSRVLRLCVKHASAGMGGMPRCRSSTFEWMDHCPPPPCASTALSKHKDPV